MKKLFTYSFFLISFIISCGSPPSECECQKELNRLLENSLYGGETESSLSRKCDRAYPNVSYLEADCE